MPLVRLFLAAVAFSSNAAAAQSESVPASLPTLTLDVRSAWRDSRGFEGSGAPAELAGSTFVDHSAELAWFLHPSLGANVDVARRIATLRLSGSSARPQEIWDGGAGLIARADLGGVIAEGHVGWAMNQLPSVVRGTGAPATVHGPRAGVGLAAPIPGGLRISTRATLLLPFAARDGRGDLADAHTTEVRVGVQKVLGTVGDLHLGLGLELRHRNEAIRGVGGSTITYLLSNSVGLSFVVLRFDREDAT